jgi:hypothetical protein
MLIAPLQSLLDRYLDTSSSMNDNDAAWTDLLNQDLLGLDDITAMADDGQA